MQRRKPKEGLPMETINWLDDADAALADAKSGNRPVLLDFSAAPM